MLSHILNIMFAKKALKFCIILILVCAMFVLLDVGLIYAKEKVRFKLGGTKNYKTQVKEFVLTCNSGGHRFDPDFVFATNDEDKSMFPDGQYVIRLYKINKKKGSLKKCIAVGDVDYINREIDEKENISRKQIHEMKRGECHNYLDTVLPRGIFEKKHSDTFKIKLISVNENENEYVYISEPFQFIVKKNK